MSGQTVDIDHERDLRIADGQPADLPRRFQVSLHDGRRHEQEIRKIVEAAARVVGRQQQRKVHLFWKCFEGEQIADGVLVFGAAQAMQERQRPWFRLRLGGAVEFGLEPRRHGVGCLLVRARHARGRHRGGAELPYDLFPSLRGRSHVGELLRVEDEPRCLESLVVARDAVPGNRGAGQVVGRRSGSCLSGRLDPSQREERCGEPRDSCERGRSGKPPIPWHATFYITLASCASFGRRASSSRR